MIKKPIVILYHADCPDGFGGAWAAWMKFGNQAEYFAVQHQAPPPAGLRSKKIYMIDFTYPLPIVRRLIKQNKRVTSIDHHETARLATKATQHSSYALNHSGAALAWLYFHPKKKMPVLVKHVEDQDLFHFYFPDTRRIMSYEKILPNDFKVWRKFSEDLEKKSSKKRILEIGAALLILENSIVDKVAGQGAELVRFSGHITYAVNSPSFDSQLGVLLYKKRPPMAIVWSRRDGWLKVSLRSDRSVDVSKIAQKYGGGGHVGSAAFRLPGNAKLPWKPLKIVRPKW